MNYKVGIYLRLSREDEKLGESSSISTQRDLLLNYLTISLYTVTILLIMSLLSK